MRYQCRGHEARGFLVVPVQGRKVRWTWQGQTVTLFAEEIEIFREEAAQH